MKLSELSNALSDMKDYWVVQDNIFSGQSSGFKYRADKDRRFRNYFKIPRRNLKTFRGIFFMETMALVSCLSVDFMDIASLSELSEMIAMMGYDPVELNQKFAPCMDTDLLTAGLATEKIAPPVILLSVAMSETLYEYSKSPKDWGSLPSMKKLRKLVLYMEEKDILYTDYKEDGYSDKKFEILSYEEYMKLHSELFLQHVCLGQEARKIGEQTEEKIRKWNQSYEKGIKQVIEDISSHAAAKDNIKELLDITLNISSAAGSQDSFFFSDSRELEKMMKYMSPKEIDFITRLIREREEITKSFERDMQKLDEAENKIKLREKEAMSYYRMSFVAEGALISILNCDEVFLSEIGQNIIRNFISNSNVPSPRVNLGGLEDDDVWDEYEDPVRNGRLALKIYDEKDFVTLYDEEGPIEEGEDDENEDEKEALSVQVNLPLSAALARYSGHAVEPHLYLRKSYIKAFRDSGYSERRARDFAVILATLDSVISMGNDSYSVEKLKYFPENIGEASAPDKNDTIQTAPLPENEITDETPDIEDLLRSGKEAEAALKQANRENQEYRHEIASLQREILKLKEELSEKSHNPEKEEAVPENSNQGISWDDGMEDAIKFPYRTNQKIVIYGGFDIFHHELLKYLPDLRIIPPAAHLDLTPIKTADIVFLQNNKTDHTGYYMARDACKSAGVPYFYLNNASAKRCAEEIVREIQKIDAT